MRISDWSSDVCSSDLAISSVRTLAEGGAITAANASQIADGSAAVLIVSEEALKIHNLTPKARIAHFSVTAGDPVMMLEEPIPATEPVLNRAGLKNGAIALYGFNEAFPSVHLPWLKALDADPEKLTFKGGPIAPGP